MNPEIKTEWLAALRSGEYKQGRFSLKQVLKKQVAHCCFGVLCEVLVNKFPEFADGIVIDNKVIRIDSGSTSMLNDTVLDHVGIPGDLHTRFMSLNDGHDKGSFLYIADEIEKAL